MQEIQGVALVANEDTILRQFSEQKQRLMDFQDDLEDIIPTLLSANGIEVANISFRIKNEDSLRKKIQFKRKYQQLTDVTDLIGCRIVTLFEPDMERVLEVLTREFEMIELIANGYSNKEIAAELFLSEGTVRNYLSMILEKLQLRDRTQVAVFYYQHK